MKQIIKLSVKLWLHYLFYLNASTLGHKIILINLNKNTLKIKKLKLCCFTSNLNFYNYIN